MSTIDGPIADPDFLRFPPFPVPPSGTKIIPFKDFKESGIQMNLSGDSDRVEVDGLGIPTVELRSKHDTDQCKTGSAVRVKKKPPPPDRGRLEGKKKWEWWEIWEEGEDLRGASFCHYSYVFFYLTFSWKEGFGVELRFIFRLSLPLLKYSCVKTFISVTETHRLLSIASFKLQMLSGLAGHGLPCLLVFVGYGIK
jgi:hypothetical protein